MKYIREQFDDFRSTTPVYVQWLLVGTVFLIIIILLTLAFSHKSPVKPEEIVKPVEFSINPQSIRFDDVKVGESERKKIDVSVSVPVVIESVMISEDDFTTPNNCTSELGYDEIQDCNINLVYTPTKAQKPANTKLLIIWYEESSEDVVHKEEVPVVFSAYEESLEDKEQEAEPEPEPEFRLMDAFEDIKPIIEPNPFKQPEEEPDEIEITPEQPMKPCSEFAIPGYDASGNQIGWIKPDHGVNKFYPLSDKSCSNPTGTYDITTGVIKSLSDGSWLGTDSDHIGNRGIRTRNINMPQLSAPQSSGSLAPNGEFDKSAKWSATGINGQPLSSNHDDSRRFNRNNKPKEDTKAKLLGSGVGESVISSMKYDRTFILRQFKPIPATIVSEVRADPSVYGCTSAKDTKCDDSKNHSIPVRATVDRNVYSDDGRTIILPTGTLLMGYLAGDLPGPYQAFGRMNIRWYQFIRPDGIEFNFLKTGQDPYSADAQGRMGVPGHGSTDYIEQMVMPLLTAMVPAAVNMIAPIADTVINQIDLDNNTVVQSGTIRSSEMAKQDIINTWNKITQKLLVDAIDNTVPPFSIAAGTRINVFSPVDLIVSCEGTGKKCDAIVPTEESGKRRSWASLKEEVKQTSNDASWVGQVRSFDLQRYCTEPDSKTGKVTIDKNSSWAESGYDYRTVLLYCESLSYQAINNAKQAVYNENVKQQSSEKYGDFQFDQTTGKLNQTGSTEQKKAYNTEVLGLKYNDEGNIQNPFAKSANSVPDAVEQDVITCEDGLAPDSNGCCPGETYTDMGEAGWNCCPDSGGDCFPPIVIE